MAANKEDPKNNSKENAVMDLITEPLAVGFEFGATLKTSMDDVMSKISRIPDVESVELGDKIAIIKVDSRDIDGVPYLFTIVYLEKDKIKVMFSVTPETSKRKRQIEVLRFVLNIVSLLSDTYDIDIASLMQLMDIIIEDIKEFATSDYEKLYNKYDALLSRVEDMKKTIEKLRESNNKLSREIIELRNERNELKLKVEELEKYSDDALMLKIQDWIREHGNEINIADFCRLYKVRESRVEQILNKMVREGYLEVRR